jgi:hypothetical protein
MLVPLPGAQHQCTRCSPPSVQDAYYGCAGRPQEAGDIEPWPGPRQVRIPNFAFWGRAVSNQQPNSSVLPREYLHHSVQQQVQQRTAACAPPSARHHESSTITSEPPSAKKIDTWKSLCPPAVMMGLICLHCSKP